MILGVSTSTFTLAHVVVSLIGIFADIIILFGMFGAKRLPGWTLTFLIATVLTSITGFLFHSLRFGPPQVLGILSLLVLVLVIPALYVYRLAGPWRWIYVAGAVLALYFNVFVGVVQAFQKLTFLLPLAPTQSEPPFLAAQTLVLAVFAVLGGVALKTFYPDGKTQHS